MTLETYVEVPFELDGQRVYPDGLIRVRRGSRSWTALVEVKTGTNALGPEQLEAYLDVARQEGFDALITISNEIPSAVGSHPTAVDRRKLRKVALHHMSWSELLTKAVMQKEFKGVADPDQAWILGELIRYLEHPRSGALSFDDMGVHWVSVRDSVSTGTLRATDAGALEVAGRFDALLRFAGLRLGRALGTEVTPVLSRQDLADPQGRLATAARVLAQDGVLSGQLRIPNTTSPMSVAVDLRASVVTCSFTVEAPGQGRPQTRVNWLVRQLRDAPDGTRVEAHVPRVRDAAAALLKDVRDDPTLLIADPKKELRSFTIALQSKMGTKRGTGRGSFIDGVLDAVDEAYAALGQRIRPWAPAPPKVRPERAVEVDESIDPALASAGLSSQDRELSGKPD